jgi:monofunctional biosynthetic peptidoglycan transglycosylase
LSGSSARGSPGDFGYVAHSDWVSMDEISPWMGLAVIAAEDQKFPEHWGFDVAAIEKALAHNERHENRVRGASTLVAADGKKPVSVGWPQLGAKRAGSGLTLGMETVWSKKRILTVYLNIAEFGDGVFGVEAASQRYFNKPASKLTCLKRRCWPLYCRIPSALRPVPRQATCEAVRRGLCARCVSWVGKGLCSEII